MPSRAIVAYIPTPNEWKPCFRINSRIAPISGSPVCCCRITTSSVGFAATAEVAPARNPVTSLSCCFIVSRPVTASWRELYKKFEPKADAVMGAMERMFI